MNTFTAYSSNSQIYKIEDNHQSNLPKAKLATVALFVFTLSSAGIITNQNHSSLNFSTKNKRETIKVSNDTDSNTNAFTFENKKGDDDMSEKMNATETLIVQHIKSSEERLARIEGKIDHNYEEVYKELKNISSNAAVQKEQIENIQKEMKELPHKVKSEIKIERNDKIISLIWAPIITGVIILIVQVALHQFKLM
ncbi:hypothetical protein [Lactococcus lactis]|uniref:hypothetical protein n=1 Tax=Lactococcus lactis TaxID=1358 RepID=UPI0035BC3160